MPNVPHHKSGHRLPALILAILLLAGSLILSLPKPAAAELGYQTTITFYSDDTFTDEVGVKIFDCAGRWVLLGESTNYYTVVRTRCVEEQPPAEPSFPATGV
jgi:hypothetical protein